MKNDEDMSFGERVIYTYANTAGVVVLVMTLAALWRWLI